MNEQPQVGDVIQGGPWDGFELISRYTRAQAIEDGVLVDVTETARQIGFKVPVALTAGVWSLIEPSDREKERYAQSTEGRLWDALWMAFLAIRRSTGSRSELAFHVLMLYDRDGRPKKTLPEELKLLAGPGDDGEFVLTVLLPDED